MEIYGNKIMNTQTREQDIPHHPSHNYNPPCLYCGFTGHKTGKCYSCGGCGHIKFVSTNRFLGNEKIGIDHEKITVYLFELTSLFAIYIALF